MDASVESQEAMINEIKTYDRKIYGRYLGIKFD